MLQVVKRLRALFEPQQEVADAVERLHHESNVAREMARHSDRVVALIREQADREAEAWRKHDRS